MGLKTSVKVGCITNLSDARYCSGMGVEYLGIRTVAGYPGYLEPEKFQAIAGWISGPEIVAEIYGLTETTSLKLILENYQPTYLELSLKAFLLFDQLPLPAFLQLSESEIQQGMKLIEERKKEIRFIILPAKTQNELIVEVAKSFKVLLKLDGILDPFLLELPIEGISIESTEEAVPGFKDYGLVAEILESLEQE